MRIVLKPTGIALVLSGLVVLSVLALRPQSHPAAPPAQPSPVAQVAQPTPPPVPVNTEGYIYNDGLLNGWTDASWAKVLINDKKFTRMGTCIRVDSGPSQALYLHHDPMSVTPFDRLSFRINGGKDGGQALKIVAQYETDGQKTSGADYPITIQHWGAWKTITVTLKQLGIAHRSDVIGFWLQDTSGQATIPTYYVSSVRFLHPEDPVP